MQDMEIAAVYDDGHTPASSSAATECYSSPHSALEMLSKWSESSRLVGHPINKCIRQASAISSIYTVDRCCLVVIVH